MLSEHAYLLLETFQMAACLRPEAKALPESLQVYEGPHSPFLSAQVSPATLQGLDLALPPWNAFTPDIQKPSCLQISLPSNLCSNVTFSKEAFPPHFKWRLLALQHSLSLFSASRVSIVLLNLLINF